MTRKTRLRPRRLILEQRIIQNDSGVTLAITALTMSVLLALTGLAVDAGWWYTLRRQNQSAADAAALSAAYELLDSKCSTSTCMAPFASVAATQNGYSGAAPEVTYPYNSDPTLVQVVTQQSQNAWFAAITKLNRVTIADRAVAQVIVLDTPCSYVLNPTAQKALSITGSAAMQSPSCSICVDSTASNSIYMQGGKNAVLQADTLITAGEISTTGQPQLQLNHPAQVGAHQTGCNDPYANTLTHSFLTTGMPTSPTCSTTSNKSTNIVSVSGTCSITGSAIPTPSKKGGTVNMSANTEITGGWDIKNETVALAPGTYWITGNLTLDTGSTLECTACVPGGAGVTIILTTNGTTQVGNVSQQSNAVVENLNAPGSGTFQNLLLIQDSNNLPPGTAPSGSNTFQGTPGDTLDGLVYFPDTALTFQGNPTTGNTSCLLTVANTLTLAGNTTVLATTGCPPSGPGGVHPIKTVTLVQ